MGDNERIRILNRMAELKKSMAIAARKPVTDRSYSYSRGRGGRAGRGRGRTSGGRIGSRVFRNQSLVVDRKVVGGSNVTGTNSTNNTSWKLHGGVGSQSRATSATVPDVARFSRTFTSANDGASKSSPTVPFRQNYVSGRGKDRVKGWGGSDHFCYNRTSNSSTGNNGGVWSRWVAKQVAGQKWGAPPTAHHFDAWPASGGFPFKGARYTWTRNNGPTTSVAAETPTAVHSSSSFFARRRHALLVGRNGVGGTIRGGREGKSLGSKHRVLERHNGKAPGKGGQSSMSVVVGDQRYRLDPQRRSLVRVPESDDKSNNNEAPAAATQSQSPTDPPPGDAALPLRVTVGGVSYVRAAGGRSLVRSERTGTKSRGAAVASERIRHALALSRASSYAVAGRRVSRSTSSQGGGGGREVGKKKKKKKDGKDYCVFFTKFGKCNKGEQCPFEHDPAKVAVCRRFLQGKCTEPACLFSHKVDRDKMPVCFMFLRGECGSSSCPYAHVNVNPAAPTCPDFERGFCARGVECKMRHVSSQRRRGGKDGTGSGKVRSAAADTAATTGAASGGGAAAFVGGVSAAPAEGSTVDCTTTAADGGVLDDGTCGTTTSSAVLPDSGTMMKSGKRKRSGEAVVEVGTTGGGGVADSVADGGTMQRQRRRLKKKKTTEGGSSSSSSSSMQPPEDGQEKKGGLLTRPRFLSF